VYVVVGCSDCSGLWVVENPRDQETATCARCGTRHRTASLRRLFEAERRETAVEARGTMLARRAGEGAAFDEVPSGDDLARAAEAAGIDDETYLAARGADPEAAAAAGDRAGSGPASSGDRPSVVREAVRSQDDPDEATVVSYATARGVPADAARDLLDRLVSRGEASVDDGVYRLL
jgi:hypothetical protein